MPLSPLCRRSYNECSAACGQSCEAGSGWGTPLRCFLSLLVTAFIIFVTVGAFYRANGRVEDFRR